MTALKRPPQQQPFRCQGGGHCDTYVTEQQTDPTMWPTAHNLDGTPHTCTPPKGTQ